MSQSEDKLFYSPIATIKVLIVCKGNTCRSAMLHSLISEKNGYKHSTIYSCGYDVKQSTIEENTKQTLIDNNIKIQKETTNKIEEYKDILFDEILILEKNTPIELLPNSKKITELYFDDPYDSGIEAYKELFIKMKDGTKGLAKY